MSAIRSTSVTATSLSGSVLTAGAKQPLVAARAGNGSSKGESQTQEPVITPRSVRSTDSEGSRFRISVVENAAKGTDYSPGDPFKSERYETLFIYEYFPCPELSLGVIPTAMRMTNTFKNLPTTETTKSFGIIPFASYLFAPSWLGSVQGGYYYDNHDWTYQEFAGGPSSVRLREQGHRFFGAAYLTWIGPSQPVSGSVRIGAVYLLQRLKAATDSIGEFIPGSNFQRGNVSLSGRIKYTPAAGWELYFQTELDYSTKVTRRVSDYRSGGGRQRIRFVAGPGIHYSFSDASEVSLSYSSVQGYGFYRENQISLRLRILL